MLNFQNPLNLTKTVIIAHRGAAHRPRLNAGCMENTIEAFEAAIAVEAEAIECDLRRTADGVIVIHHNKSLKNAHLPIAAMTYNHCRRLARKRGFHLPTLPEMLQFCRNRISLNLELKESGYEEQVLDETGRFFSPANVLLSTFNDDSMTRIKEISAEYPTGLLVGLPRASAFEKKLRIPPLTQRLMKCRADYAVVHWRLLTNRFHRKLTESGFPVIAWTVDRPYTANRLIKRSVDGLITNHPERIKAL